MYLRVLASGFVQPAQRGARAKGGSKMKKLLALIAHSASFAWDTAAVTRYW
jgi:hypothetical protein